MKTNYNVKKTQKLYFMQISEMHIVALQKRLDVLSGGWNVLACGIARLSGDMVVRKTSPPMVERPGKSKASLSSFSSISSIGRVSAFPQWLQQHRGLLHEKVRSTWTDLHIQSREQVSNIHSLWFASGGRVSYPPFCTVQPFHIIVRKISGGQRLTTLLWSIFLKYIGNIILI